MYVSDFLISFVALLELFAVVFASRERERGREEERKEGTERAKETRAKEQATIKRRERGEVSNQRKIYWN